MDGRKNYAAQRKAAFLRAKIPTSRYLAFSLFAFAALTIAWTVASASGFVQPVFLPAPVEVAKALGGLLVSGQLLPDVWASIWRVIVGFLLGVCLALPVGILMGSLQSAEALLQPTTDFLRYMPVPAFLPLCILWFGIGDLEKIIVIFLGTFFQLAVLVADNARGVPDQLLEIGYTLGFGRLESLWRIVLPGALPRIFDDLRVSFGWAWSYVVVAEIVAADRGLGFMIMQSQRYLRTADVIGGVVLIGLIGIAADWVFRILSRKLFPYEDSL